MNRSASFHNATLAAAALCLSACASTPPDDPSDPFESANRVVYGFNMKADKYLLKPVATTYVDYVPNPARKGVNNFLSNLFYPTVIINDVLQLKPVQFAQDLGRFLLNSTAGLAGFLDVASDVGLPEHSEDFGQTLGYWGIGPGWYLMVPLLGPLNNRDLIGRAGDYFTSIVSYQDDDIIYPVNGMNLIDTRASLLSADSFLEQQIDPYIAVRTAYLQQRLGKVYDGNPPAPKFEEFEE